MRDVGYISAGFALTAAALGAYAGSIRRRLRTARHALDLDTRQRAGRHS